MLAYRPHTATVYPVTTVEIDDAVVDHAREPGAQVLGQLTQKNARRDAEVYGLDSMNVGLWLCNLEDADKIAMGDHLQIAEARWRALHDPKRHGAETVTSHASVLVEKVGD